MNVEIVLLRIGLSNVAIIGKNSSFALRDVSSAKIFKIIYNRYWKIY